jgi:hypothetical protein
MTNKFNAYLDESRETRGAVNEFVETSYDLYKSYGHSTGYLQSLVGDLISQLPKAKRAEYRAQLLRQAQNQQNELLSKTIKETV